MSPQVSIVMPVYNEGQSIEPIVQGIRDEVQSEFELLVVYDDEADTTAPVAQAISQSDPRVKPTLNTFGRGPANAIRYGISVAAAPIVVVTMSDGSDSPEAIDQLADQISKGASIAAASRYMKGGRQIGGPLLKRTLSRLAGVSLFYLARVGTHDATNSFKAYSAEFIQAVGIESSEGFELGIEMVAKAKRRRARVVEVPTTWRDRSDGMSNFKMMQWLPHYLKWYLYAYGPRQDQVIPVRAKEGT